jgi:hypothetical protein
MKRYEVIYRHSSGNTFVCQLYAMGQLDAYIQVSVHGDPIDIRRIS